MALSTYNDLTTSVTNHLDRSDLSSVVGDFVTICESRVNRRLRVREMETEADVSLVAGTRTAALPSDFREVRRLYLNTSPVRFLDFMSPQDYWARYTGTNTGKPVVFTVEGSNLVFGPTPDAAYTGKLQYYRTLPALSSSVHSVYTANPDLYVYGSLCAAEPYLKNDKRLQVWQSEFERIIRELEMQSSRHPGPMVMRDDYNPY